MFLGHFALGFAAKRVVPRASLGVLVAAPVLLDLLWPVFLLLGWERAHVAPGGRAFTTLAFDAYPISHSLVTAAGWGIAAGAAYWAVTRYRAGAIAVAALVVSHWFLDALTHLPDMPLYPGGAVVGLGLWRSVAATLVVEIPLFLIGLAVYTRATTSRDAVGRWVWWGFIALLALVYAANVAGPPPPSLTAVAYAGILGGWGSVLLAGWADRHRTLSDPSSH